MTEIMAVNEDGYFRNVRLTPERRRVRDAMATADEGLGPRAYRCLLQLRDGQPLSENDAEWMTDGVEQPEIARRADDGRCILTAYGLLLAQAADRGDVEAMLALTTMPELMDATS